MLNPPRKAGKRLIGRFLLLRIIIGSIVLVAVTVGSVFWAISLGLDLDQQRSQASNTLTFSAISICLSARFAYNSACSMRIFKGNKFCWYVHHSVGCHSDFDYVRPWTQLRLVRNGPDEWNPVGHRRLVDGCHVYCDGN